MKRKLFIVVLFITSFGMVFGSFILPVKATTFPSVGVIRWDASATGGASRLIKDEISLSPNQWNDRLPFFSTRSSDGAIQMREENQYLMDQEIAYAKAAGIDYWAFDYYGLTSSYANYSNGLNLYLNSNHKTDMKFSLALILWQYFQDDWPTNVVNYLKDPQYQTVLGGRPLIYIFGDGPMGTSQSTYDALRSAATAAGLPNPYIVWMTWNVNDGMTAQLGLDAESAYALAPTGSVGSLQTYNNLAAVDQQFWDTAKSIGSKVVPQVTTGWDPRPRWESGTDGSANSAVTSPPGTPSEIASNLQSAADWIASNPSIGEANTVIMYAWNENAEGGWLVPLTQSGSARLDAIRQIIPGAPATETMPPVVSISAPAQNSTIQNTTTLSAVAFDNVGVSGVQFKLDGSNLAQEDTSSPYSISWDTTSASNGSHALLAVVRDGAGNQVVSAPISITISNQITQPTPTLTLSASSYSIISGDSSTLTWSSTNATSCTASGPWSGTKSTSGSQNVSPSRTSTYTLSCTGSGGSVSKSRTITVSTDSGGGTPPPPPTPPPPSSPTCQIRPACMYATPPCLISVPTGGWCPPVPPNPPILAPITITLRRGIIHPQVKILQQYLNNHNFPVSVFGAGSVGNETFYFGLKTKAAVVNFQRSHFLVPDGVVGPKTRAFLIN